MSLPDLVAKFRSLQLEDMQLPFSTLLSPYGVPSVVRHLVLWDAEWDRDLGKLVKSVLTPNQKFTGLMA